MRYTPLSRFQGTVLGAAIGNILGVNCRNRPGSTTPKSWTDVTYWGFQPIDSESLLDGSMTWGRVAVEHLRQLTRSPFVQNQPLQLTELPVQNLATQDSAPCSQVASHDQDLEAGLAIATLPFALFYHEDLHLLRQQIHLIVAQKTVVQAHLPEAELGATVVHGAIALAIQNQLQPFQLIPQLLADLQLSQFHSALAEQLTQVQKRLVGQTAETLTDEILTPFHSRQLSPITLALFAFLSTPEDFRLSLLRAAQLSSAATHACTLTLTGALSGAYNGKAVLPPDWRTALRGTSENRSPLSRLWDVESEDELLQYAQSLLSLWSGMYPSTQYLSNSSRLTVVGAPRTLRN